MTLLNSTYEKLRNYKKKKKKKKRKKEKRKSKVPLPSDSNYIVILNLLEFGI